VVRHVLGIEQLPEEHEPAKNVPDGSLLLMAVGNPRMLGPSVVKDEVVFIVGVDDTALSQGEGEVVFVLGTEEPRDR
jgi:hypothetical protein